MRLAITLATLVAAIIAAPVPGILGTAEHDSIGMRDTLYRCGGGQCYPVHDGGLKTRQTLHDSYILGTEYGANGDLDEPENARKRRFADGSGDLNTDSVLAEDGDKRRTRRSDDEPESESPFALDENAYGNYAAYAPDPQAYSDYGNYGEYKRAETRQETIPFADPDTSEDGDVTRRQSEEEDDPGLPWWPSDSVLYRSANDKTGPRKRDTDSGSITTDPEYYGPEFGYYKSYKRNPSSDLSEEVQEALCIAGEFSSEDCLPSDSTSELDKRDSRKRDLEAEVITSSGTGTIEIKPLNEMEASAEGIAPSKRDPQQSC